MTDKTIEYIVLTLEILAGWLIRRIRLETMIYFMNKRLEEIKTKKKEG